jgi:uncharacterized protein GlcG (DUF336 family)
MVGYRMSALPLALARELVDAACERACELGVAVSAAVVDAGGNLVAFSRMDGAEIAGPTLAVDKAYTAVAQSTSTRELAALAAPGGPLHGLHANGGGRYVIFPGGVPLYRDGVIIGGIGVSGAAIEEDEACAEAGAVLLRTG